MNTLDLLGSTLGLLDTLLLIRASIWAWPVGIAAILLNLVLYCHTALYADAALQLFYLIFYCYGWWYWQRKSAAQISISNLTKQQLARLLILIIVSCSIISLFLFYYTNSTTPVWDASTTVIALVAQWCTCRKILENWLLWFINDALYAGLYLHKSLPFHCLEHLLYLGFAIAGYYCWRAQQQRERAVAIL
jgi:nicotinamide mononucleotide transporter